MADTDKDGLLAQFQVRCVVRLEDYTRCILWRSCTICVAQYTRVFFWQNCKNSSCKKTQEIRNSRPISSEISTFSVQNPTFLPKNFYVSELLLIKNPIFPPKLEAFGFKTKAIGTLEHIRVQIFVQKKSQLFSFGSSLASKILRS